LTDGRSSTSLTIAEAERAHKAGIIMIAIGVGSSIDRTELDAIASDPKCLHLFLLSGFDEIDDLKYAIEQRACEGITLLVYLIKFHLFTYILASCILNIQMHHFSTVCGESWGQWYRHGR